jgi:hypothetical protein
MSVEMGKASDRNTNFHWVRVGSLTLYFPYRTVVAFDDGPTGTVVSENVWSVTTGRHLNELDGGDKKSRVPHDEFVKKLSESLERHGLEI